MSLKKVLYGNCLLFIVASFVAIDQKSGNLLNTILRLRSLPQPLIG